MYHGRHRERQRPPKQAGGSAREHVFESDGILDYAATTGFKARRTSLHLLPASREYLPRGLVDSSTAGHRAFLCEAALADARSEGISRASRVQGIAAA